MRAIYSYGVALVIVLVVAVWLGSGLLITGGKGPGAGETPVIGSSEVPPSPEQQKLIDEAAAKQKAADDAKAAADAAAEDAKKAAAVADGADTSGKARQEELKKAADAKQAAAKAAKDASDAAAKAAAAAETAAEAAVDAVNSFKTIAERLADRPSSEEPQARSVRIAIITAQNEPIEVPLRGRTKAKSTVSVVAQTSGIVQAISVSKGQAVKPGDLLCTLDQGARKLAVTQAQAGVDQAQTAFDSNAALVKKGLAAPNTTLAVQSQLAAAKTGLESAQLELSRTEIRTDVGGVVQDPMAEVGNMLGAGAPCATIVQLNPMLFVAQIPEAKMAYARLGLSAKITTVTGATADGKVTYIASTADDATRSFPVEIEVANDDGKVLNGVTADAVVNIGTAPVHVLPQSVLTLDDSGVLGIRTVEDGNKVAFHAVTIIKDTRDGVWVVGLPYKISVITVGQEYVQPGQIVDAKTDDTPIGAGADGSNATASSEQPS